MKNPTNGMTTNINIILTCLRQSICGLQTVVFLDIESAAANSSLAKWRVTCFHDSLVLKQSAVLRSNYCAKNQPLVTFNTRDFKDVCSKNKLKLFTNYSNNDSKG